MWFSVIVAALCWPVIEGRGARLLGDELGSSWRALWTGQRTLVSLEAGLGWPTEARDLAAPVGGHFVSPSPLFDALTLPLRQVLGPVSAFDVLAMAHLLLAAVGGFWLGRMAGLREQGALVSGTVFGFNALLLSAGAASGAPEVLGMAWVPFALGSLVWLLRAPGPLPALAVTASVALMGLADLHLALFAPLVAPVLVAPWLLGQGLIARDAPGRAGRSVLWVALGIGAAALLTGQLLGPLVTTLIDPDALLPPGGLSPEHLPSPEDLGQSLSGFATLAGALLPGSSYVSHRGGAAVCTVAIYAGWLSLGLAAAGARVGRLRWLALALLGLILAMGPYLLVTPDGWRPVPVAWWTWLAQTFPPYALTQSYVRAMAFAYAGLAVLAGAGAELLFEQSGRRVWVPWLASAAIMAETLAFSAVPTPLPSASVWIPGAVTRLRSLPREGAVLDWPQREGSATDEIPRYLYYQLWHGRPIFTDLASGEGPTGLESNPFFAELERLTYGETYRSPAWSAATSMPIYEGVSAMQGMGYVYVVLHPWHLAPDRRERVAQWLAATLTVASQEDDGSAVYALRARSAEDAP